MRVRTSHSKEFKDAIVAKLLNRGERTIASVCEEEGVLKSTATNWLNTSASVPGPSRARGRMKWNAEAKLKAVFETSNLDETELGKYLRREGLYSNQVAEWRAAMIERLDAKPSFARDERDQKISVLEREVLRKDKALAEASALLILQKKADLIWGSKSADAR